MPNWHLVMVDRVEPDGTVEAEPVTVQPLPGGGRQFVLDDGTALRFHGSDWSDLVQDDRPEPPTLRAA